MLDSYIICGTPRTGSTLLCDLLASTKRAGAPDSFYGRKFMPDWAAAWHLPDPATMIERDYAIAYLDAAIRAGKAGTAIFGLRLMRENLDELSILLDLIYPGLPSDTARFEKAFGRILYIHLFRENKLEQAISYIKAQQTGLWHVAPDGTEIERLAPPQEPRYDFARLKEEVEKLEAYDAAWHAWFAAQDITPLRIGYEALSTDPAGSLARICVALGIAAPAAADVKPGVAKLSDETSRDWIRRYQTDSKTNSLPVFGEGEEHNPL
ncbi:MAG: sulfotransferase [Rhizobiales bacterium]|nr:sulfotransferase [Hyphomicrobiales bacterium]